MSSEVQLKRGTMRVWWWVVAVGLMVSLWGVGGVGYGAESGAEVASEAVKPGVAVTLLGRPVIAVFLVVAVGMLIGQVKGWGVSLGSSGVLFASLAYGAMMPVGEWTEGVTDSFNVLGRVGLVLFVYCVGLAAGPTFFRAFKSGAKNLVKLGIVIVVVGTLTTVGFAELFDVPMDLAVGIFSGAMTSTPALAAATEAVGQIRGVSGQGDVAVGYGIAYAFGVIGVVLFVQLLPRVLGKDLRALGEEVGLGDPERQIVRQLVTVTNEGIVGKHVEEVGLIAEMMCAVPRVLREGKLVPVGGEFRFEKGVDVLVIGRRFRVRNVVDYLGKKSDAQVVMDTEKERRQVVATSHEVVGKAIGELQPTKQWGVTVTRIGRVDVEFVPSLNEVIQNGDVLTVVGEEKDLQVFADAAGHREAAVHETDLISLAIGIVAGVVLGLIPFTLPGAEAGSGFKLGLAGGPLLVALLLGHFGKIGRIVGRMPRASRIVLMELGLVFFLANAGVKAGGQMLGVIQTQGVMLLVMGVVVTLVPMAIGYLVARVWLKMPMLEVLGAVCGGMTSTPGLGAITAKTDSDVPVISYAAAYPMALILMTVFAKLMVSVFGA
ncbi:Aspartate/alanine antiporter [Poriferisphaera corsica]|uniref:Aspartate/alanine antiporter n=1 Tax=Poriferisphaera corsica TaxID=2528020 RepID=A0A517YWS8_9BACT|nr:TrkA C-terminal domain-containing protein [Poriferisphaera corsica]QDU34685.1 Aspartate/alanine antiporter [Poriferisphaera corsica]